MSETENNVEIPAVLIIDPDPILRRAYRRILEGKRVELLLASNLKEAEALFRASFEKLTIIATAGRVPVSDMDVVSDNVQETAELIKKMRTEGFGGVMLAMSGSPLDNKILIKAGCSSEFPEKAKICTFILTMLNLD